MRRSYGTSSPVWGFTRFIWIRTLPSESSWLKRTVLRWTAEYSLTGTFTSPNEIAPVQIARGMARKVPARRRFASPAHGMLRAGSGSVGVLRRAAGPDAAVALELHLARD